MKIASQIRILFLLLLVISAGFGYSYWQTAKNLENRRAVNEAVQNLIKATFELNIITNEYISSSNERIKMQWHNRHNSLELIFINISGLLTYDDDKLSLEKIKKNEIQAEELFFQFEDINENHQNNLDKISTRKRTQLISQIHVRIQGMLSEASRISRRSLSRLIISEEKLEFTAGSLLFILWPIFIISFLLIDRKIIKPITKLQQSAEQLASGDYDARISVPGNNEVSALARSYNKLASDIQIKINSLTDKSKRLNQSQQELLSLNLNLQKMVEDQTSDLRDSETRQRAILESMHDCVITMDEAFNIKNVNPAIFEMFGFSEDETINKNINNLVAYSPGNKSFSSDYVEALGKHKENNLFPIEMSLNEIEIDSKLMYSAIIRDNTIRKRTEKTKTEFIGTVSHELRTPLTAIRGSLGLINGGAVGDIPAKAKDLLNTAGRNTERLLNLINDLLDIQKIEAGKMECQFARVDLKDVIEKSISDNASYADQFNVVIQNDNTLTDAFVYIDSHRLSQVMANLLSNAAKFSPENSKVKIATSIEGSFVKISVVDQGEGIPENFHKKIFSKFSQNDSSTTRQKGGTGLGLSITKQIMEIMGGKIDFTSIFGEGTTFNIYVPLVKNSSVA